MVFRRSITGVVCLALALSTGGCASTGNTKEDDESNKAIMGALLGAVIGGMAGSRVGSGSGRSAATALGVVAGAAVGQALGARLAQGDRLRHEAALREAMSASASNAVTWKSDSTTARGQVTPLSSSVNAGRQCRNVNESITIDGKTDTVNRTYCQESDGSLSLLN